MILIQINKNKSFFYGYIITKKDLATRLVVFKNQMQLRRIEKRSRRNKNLFLILIFTNLFFISFSLLPFYVSFILFKGHKHENEIGQTFASILSYTNNAFNFLLYGLTSHKYREESAMLILQSGDRFRSTVKLINQSNQQTGLSCPSNNKQLGSKRESLKENSKLLTSSNKQLNQFDLDRLKLNSHSIPLFNFN